ncbi:MAG TPA: hypothetical protein V6D03_10315, partial [Candidatus Caenarcaniphilales bacterium]
MHLKKGQNWRLSLGIAFASGVCMGAAPAPLNAWPLAWIALAPLWYLTQRHRAKEAALLGAMWGAGYHGLALSWITGVHPMTWLGVPWLASLAIALTCWAFITLWGAVLVAIWAGGMAISHFWILDFRGWIVPESSTQNAFLVPEPGQKSKISSWRRLLFGVGLWSGLEWLWSHTPLWWTSLAYTQSPGNLAVLHLGQLSGPLTVTASLVAINGLVAEAWLNVRPRWPRFGLAAILLVSLHLAGWGLYSFPLAQPRDTALKVGIIQGNIPNEVKLDTAGWRRALAGYTTGYQALAAQGVDAVLTPEGALPFLWT